MSLMNTIICHLSVLSYVTYESIMYDTYEYITYDNWCGNQYYNVHLQVDEKLSSFHKLDFIYDA